MNYRHGQLLGRTYFRAHRMSDRAGDKTFSSNSPALSGGQSLRSNAPRERQNQASVNSSTFLIPQQARFRATGVGPDNYGLATGISCSAAGLGSEEATRQEDASKRLDIRFMLLKQYMIS